MDGPLEVTAPNGTGKTELTIRRFCWLVKKKIAWAPEVAIVTFSRKAATEMRERLQLQLEQDIDQLPIATFHSLARSILSMQAGARQETLRIIDPQQSFRLVKQAMVDCKLSEKVWPPAMVYDLITTSREQGITAEKFLTVPESRSQQKLAAVYARYEAQIREKKGYDFPGLILGARQLLENDYDLLEELQDRFRFLMVDEWQDTSPGQYDFLRLLALQHRNLMVVGAGEPQSIYEWRQANFKELDASFRSDFPEVETVVLTDNLRSTAPIIRAAAAVFGGQYPELNLVPQRGDGDKVQDIRVADEHAEAVFIAAEVQRLAKTGVRLKDISVLYRTNEQSLMLEQQLMAHSLPYVLHGRQKLYHRKEVRDVLAYLTLSQGQDPAALTLILNAPTRGVGPVAQRKVKGDQTQVTELRLQQAIERASDLELSASAIEGIRRLQKTLAQLREHHALRPADLIVKVVEDTGYRAWVSEDLDGETRLQSLRLLAREAEAYARVPEFLADIRTRLADDFERPADEDAVTLLTVHAAKGLQWTAVFVVGMEEGLLPYARSLTHGAETGERRLAHVAFSRARDHLYLVSAASRPDHAGRRVYPRASRYLSALPREIVERSSWAS